VDFNLSPAEDAFRQEVRDFLEEYLPPRSERPKDYVQNIWLPRVREGGMGRVLVAQRDRGRRGQCDTADNSQRRNAA
jgi:hypothetical protein